MEEKINKIKKIIRKVDKVKGVIFLIAIVMLLYTMLGGKAWGEYQWFMESEPYAYIVLFFSLIAVVVVNLGKVFLVMYHNRLVRKSK